uniref:Uncharacterized protein n=1 Tax=Zea mays TaxID=4577 RepID=C4J575_MAIZE|nr:unknown [Zea mays]
MVPWKLQPDRIKVVSCFRFPMVGVSTPPSSLLNDRSMDCRSLSWPMSAARLPWMPMVESFMEITLSPPHVTPSHGDSPQGSSDWPQDGGAFCH